MPITKTDNKKDGRIQYRVRIGYTTPNGDHRQIERKVFGLQEAKETEKKLMSELGETEAKRLTVQALYDEYTASKSYEVRKSSLEKTKTILSNHVLPTMGDMKIYRLSVANLQKWKLSIEKKGLSNVMRRNIFGEFRALINYAVKMEYLPTNPLLKVGNFKSTIQQKKEMLFYTPEEFNKFISAAKIEAETKQALEWDYYVFFMIAFYTGLRKGEIHGLQWSNINDGYLSVERSIAQKQKGEDVVTAPKNKSSIRTIQIPLPLQTALNEHYKRWQKITGFDDSYYICGGIKSLRDTTIGKRNEYYAENAGVKKIRIHDFRHSHASLLANNSINIQEVARRLGHSNIEMTWNVYSHLYPKAEEKAIEILNEVPALN